MKVTTKKKLERMSVLQYHMLEKGCGIHYLVLADEWTALARYVREDVSPDIMLMVEAGLLRDGCEGRGPTITVAVREDNGSVGIAAYSREYLGEIGGMIAYCDDQVLP